MVEVNGCVARHMSLSLWKPDRTIYSPNFITRIVDDGDIQVAQLIGPNNSIRLLHFFEAGISMEAVRPYCSLQSMGHDPET